ncbi:MAG: radical SAM protein [Acholeplasmataceae bacterium]
MKSVVYHEIGCSQALNKLKRRMPYSWDLNVYRGCQHGCVYCYARHTHDYLGSDDFSNDIFIKTNIVERLEKELSHPNWRKEVINIGGVTDSYQPAEEHYRIMPDVLRLLIEYRTPAIISTKSDLILRDYDLIDALARITYVNIAVTVTTMDEDLRARIEPDAVESYRRFNVLKAFANTSASTGLHVMPIIPHLTDGPENFAALFQMGKKGRRRLRSAGHPLSARQNEKTIFCFHRKRISEPVWHLYRALSNRRG